MKEDDYSGSLEYMLWLRARTLGRETGRNVWDVVRRGKHSNTSYSTALGGKSGG